MGSAEALVVDVALFAAGKNIVLKISGKRLKSFRVDNVMVRYSCDRYQEREQLLKKETHFQNRGKNWAPVPDLCKSKLSVGSPCYDTCRGKQRKSMSEEDAAGK